MTTLHDPTEQQHRARLRGELEVQHAIAATDDDPPTPSKRCDCGHVSTDHNRYKGRACRVTQYVTTAKGLSKRLCGCTRYRATNAAVAAANEGRA